jgi:hypothetical protein
LPSAALPLDLDAGLDGDSLLSDPLFASEQGYTHSKALLAALAPQTGGPAGNAAPLQAISVAGSNVGAGSPGSAASRAAPQIRLDSGAVNVSTGPQPRVPGATFVVNTTASGDNLLSLRDAIKASITKTSIDGSPIGTGNDVITFDPSLAGQTITLSLQDSVTVNNMVPGRSAFV